MTAPVEPGLPSQPEPVYPTARQRFIIWTTLSVLSVSTLLAVAALVFFGFISFLGWCYPILLPIGLAIIIALVLEPLVDQVQKRGLNRSNATLVVCILSIIAFLLFWAPLVSMTGSFVTTLPKTLNESVTKLQATLSNQLDIPPAEHTGLPETEVTLTSTNALITAVPPSATGTTEVKPVRHPSELQKWLTANLPAIQETIQKNLAALAYSILGPVGQAFGFILGFGFVPIYVYYFLADQEQISRHWHDYIPLRRSPLRDEVISVLTEINTSLVSYFRGQIVVAGCNGALTFLGLWIIGVPYSLPLGIITGALSIVPFLGIIASIIPALLLGFLSAKGDPTWQWLSPLLVIGVFTLVQMSESMFITPRVQSHSTGLHPLAIVLGILFWSLLLPGLLGPIVAVPLTCALVVLMRRYVWKDSLEESPERSA